MVNKNVTSKIQGDNNEDRRHSDIIQYDGEKHEIVWIYNNDIIEIKLVRKSQPIPKIIPIHISELDKVS